MVHFSLLWRIYFTDRISNVSFKSPCSFQSTFVGDIFHQIMETSTHALHPKVKLWIQIQKTNIDLIFNLFSCLDIIQIHDTLRNSINVEIVLTGYSFTIQLKDGKVLVTFVCHLNWPDNQHKMCLPEKYFYGLMTFSRVLTRRHYSRVIQRKVLANMEKVFEHRQIIASYGRNNFGQCDTIGTAGHCTV